MLITADWVLPVESAPLRGGGVRVRTGRIAEVGPAENLSPTPGQPRMHFPGCAIVPGLVNAHTHLSLTALAGLLPSTDFATWLRRIVPMIAALDTNDIAASTTLGALRCLSGGVTCVGDIAYGPEAPAAASDMGLGGVFYWEVLGVPASQLMATLAEAEFPQGKADGCSGRTKCGISPHTPYTSGPGLLRATAELARREGYPLAVHVAESPAETRLLMDGTGPLAPVAARLAHGFKATGTSPVAYLAELGVLDDALAVHAVQLGAGDGHLLAARTRGVAVCPRSNEFLHNGHPAMETLMKAKATIGIGTDSAASNSDLDLFAEARALLDMTPALTPSRVLRMMTLEGATALGVQDRFGSLKAGKQADFAVVRVNDTEHPAEAVVLHGGPGRVEAVMSAGIWRVREGRPTVAVDRIEQAAAAATARAKAADTGA